MTLGFDFQIVIELELAKTRIEFYACVTDIDRWMSQNLLKLDRPKTELLILNAKYHDRTPPIASSYRW